MIRPFYQWARLTKTAAASPSRKISTDVFNTLVGGGLGALVGRGGRKTAANRSLIRTLSGNVVGTGTGAIAGGSVGSVLGGLLGGGIGGDAGRMSRTLLGATVGGGLGAGLGAGYFGSFENRGRNALLGGSLLGGTTFAAVNALLKQPSSRVWLTRQDARIAAERLLEEKYPDLKAHYIPSGLQPTGTFTFKGLPRERQLALQDRMLEFNSEPTIRQVNRESQQAFGESARASLRMIDRLRKAKLLEAK